MPVQRYPSWPAAPAYAPVREPKSRRGSKSPGVSPADKAGFRCSEIQGKPYGSVRAKAVVIATVARLVEKAGYFSADQLYYERVSEAHGNMRWPR